jgi:hypothetical protein
MTECGCDLLLFRYLLIFFLERRGRSKGRGSEAITVRQPRWQREFRWDHRPDPDATIQIKSLPLEPFRESIPVELL